MSSFAFYRWIQRATFWKSQTNVRKLHSSNNYCCNFSKSVVKPTVERSYTFSRSLLLLDIRRFFALSSKVHDQMKEFERKFEQYLPTDKIFVVRVDGARFSQFTKDVDKPMDERSKYSLKECFLFLISILFIFW